MLCAKFIDKFKAKLCDFGIITESARTMKTNCGTACYRAPEIRSGKYGTPADVYALLDFVKFELILCSYAYGMILLDVIQSSTTRLSYLSKLQLEICGIFPSLSFHFLRWGGFSHELGDDYTKTRPEARPTSREVLTRMLRMPGSATTIC